MSALNLDDFKRLLPAVIEAVKSNDHDLLPALEAEFTENSILGEHLTMSEALSVLLYMTHRDVLDSAISSVIDEEGLDSIGTADLLAFIRTLADKLPRAYGVPNDAVLEKY